MWLGGISCQSVWGMIFQWGSTLKVSIELPVTSRHRRNMTERLLKATLSPNQTKLEMCPQYMDAPAVGYLTIKLQNSDLLYILTPRPTRGHDSGATVPYIKRSCFRDFPQYIIRSFVTKQNRVYIKKMYVSSFHSVSPCLVMSFEQVFWSVTSCFRVFPLYLIRFICYETEMGL